MYYNPHIVERANSIKLLIFGVDGVLTDAGMYFGPNGDLLRKFNRRDGLGIQLLQRNDIKSAIISSMSIPIAVKWAKMFKVDSVSMGVGDKLHEMEKLQMHYGLKPHQVAYISDDIDEYAILKRVGFAVTVADGMDANKEASHYITSLKGGEGAVRETIELIINCKKQMKNR